MRDESDPPESDAPAGRRSPAAAKRPRRINPSFTEAEHATVLAHAKAAGLKPAAYVAKAALRGGGDPDQLPLDLADVPEEARLLRVLLGLGGELRRAAAAGDDAEVAAVARRIDDVLLEIRR